MIIDKKQLRDDIKKRKELPKFGISSDKNIQRLRIITETRRSFTPEVVEALLDELEQQHINSQSVPLQLTTTVDGREWQLFCVNFKSDDAVHSAYFYAIDREHASYRLEDLKQTGELQWGNLLSITG